MIEKGKPSPYHLEPEWYDEEIKILTEKLNVAREALGWTWSTDIRFPSSRKKWHSKDDHNKIVWDRDWTPSTNLIQAVDHIVPVLEEMFGGVQLFFFTDDADIAIITNCGREYLANGQGSTPSERMAHALCQVFLKVKNLDPTD